MLALRFTVELETWFPYLAVQVLSKLLGEHNTEETV